MILTRWKAMIFGAFCILTLVWFTWRVLMCLYKVNLEGFPADYIVSVWLCSLRFTSVSNDLGKEWKYITNKRKIIPTEHDWKRAMACLFQSGSHDQAWFYFVAAWKRLYTAHDDCIRMSRAVTSTVTVPMNSHWMISDQERYDWFKFIRWPCRVAWLLQSYEI